MYRPCVSLAVLLAAVMVSSCSPKEAVRPAEAPRGAAAAPEDNTPQGPPRIEVTRARLLAANQFLEVHFRMFGMRKYNPEPDTTYAVDEATGEKFYITWLRRIGRMASTKGNADGSYQHMLLKNREGLLKPGAKITVVVGPARQGNVELAGE